jgi:hypothetical protein
MTMAACAGVLAAALSVAGSRASADQDRGNMLVFDNASGQARTFSTAGAIDTDNPFFEDLGTNGRRCVTCHQPSDGWSITPQHVQARFWATNGHDPIFHGNDGSNCEGVVGNTIAERRAASSLLLTRGLIRIAFDVPQGAEFIIDGIDDPNHCGFNSNDTSLYRRPLPSTNLRFLSAVMWDGRESSSTTTILQDLAQQANDATLGHAQAVQGLSARQMKEIVSFETSLYTAQARDREAGNLQSHGADGGPLALTRQPFFIGINDVVGLNPTGAPFDPNVFTLFNAWMRNGKSDHDDGADARRSIARGPEIFNTHPITLSGVGGLNGATFSNGVHVPDTIVGSCTTCHDAPNAGDHSVKAPLDIGLTDPSRAPYLPVYTLRRLSTGETIRTTDPGRAMISGKWADVSRFKGPILRGLASRAPYFHNGSAMTLDEVIDFYTSRFGLALTPRERADLIAFLRSL